MYIICININVEEEMKVRTNNNGMKQLKDLGFKKIKTEPGFHMYELNPAELGARQRIHDNLKAEAAIKAHDQQPLTTKEYNKIKATSSKPQATSRKQQALDKSK
jgi:quinol monooxygenase YgiN